MTSSHPRLSGMGATFPSAMQMDPKTFEGIRVTNLFERCPKCSRVSRFNKPDYLFRARVRLRSTCAPGEPGGPL